ncbi:hypothetical protein CTI12_AA446280 [Artemisia annua]|uniref:Uncharacterized protein n=1 Tax=Artemisia annua TaxID=35608 RepID=A0A2U1LWE1_ARTAN|nr:hypothetical protein CTI12_AA446280 [Artemisia annua]
MKLNIRVDRELKDEMIIAIPNVEDEGEILHTHDDFLCPKRAIEKPKKQCSNHDGFQQPPRHTSRGTNMGYKFQFKPKKQVYQAVSKKKGSSSSGTKKNFEVPRQETTSANPFDALNTTEKDDELRSNGGFSNS